MKVREGYRRQRRRWTPSAGQRSVLQALVRGGTNAEIAADLGMSSDGVKWYVGELLQETGLRNRRELARWWSLPLEVPADDTGRRGPTMLLESAITSHSWSSEAGAER